MNANSLLEAPSFRVGSHQFTVIGIIIGVILIVFLVVASMYLTVRI